jgi:hypothetical protein
LDGVSKVKPRGLRVWEGYDIVMSKKQITNKELISSGES